MTSKAVRKLPWLDRSGQLSFLKLTTLVLVALPAAWILGQLLAGMLMPRPLEEMIHQTGNWAVRLLVASLCITPLRGVLRWPRLMLVRRMVGVAALAYALSHLLLYVVDQQFDLLRVGSEILLRFYLTIGFVALLGLAALGATSTDAAIRRMGGWWRRLHRLAYPVTALALLHFFIQSKIDVTEPVLLTGLFLLLMGYRLLALRGVPGPLRLAGLALAAALLCALVEAAWYATMRNAPVMRVLEANLQLAHTIRPAWWVLLAGLAAAGASWWRQGRDVLPARSRPLGRTAGRLIG
ncbi:MAG TPA: ferric reductase-like transmembrane domain-containing protein [Geminicoccus sp.]|uniref:sulfite oxidase heme-binding subunit YedZ n=1 Tax=Geminicoccus sp. TaxID=2024832 RepID=UPI002B95D784|nr:ferric reductase-like transmembrane domain-containing protein [Geminicoccus sp.]HWL69467.1 ferric reductase-like transmembrane domain-containing protein [Geminicoccus sp.]